MTAIAKLVQSGRSQAARAQDAAHLDGLHTGEVGISGIADAEPDYGVSTSGSPCERQAPDKFLAPWDVLPFDEAVMQCWRATTCARSSGFLGRDWKTG